MPTPPEPPRLAAARPRAGRPAPSRRSPLRESRAARRTRAAEIALRLAAAYPDAHCALVHRDPFELLVAVILSAQTTDAKVNEVTPTLFARFPDAAALAAAPQDEVEAIVHPLGFFRSKARAIRETAASLVERHDGRVPDTLGDLTELRGVGRKTANVVLGECFATPGVTVDTHVRRLSQRLALTEETEPDRIERDLMALLPAEDWTPVSHRLIWHGRRICTARRPDCPACPLLPLCPTGQGLRGG
jgi:endonuclease-3